MNINLPEIGKILRERREGQGISVHEVSDALCLRKSLVEAIEAGNWEPLPHEVYVKGFAKDYANFLGVYNEVAAYFDVHEKIDQPLPVVAAVPVRQKAVSPFRRFARVRVAFFAFLAIVMIFFIYERVERERVVTSKTETATRAAETSHIEGDTGGVVSVSGAKSSGDTDRLAAISEPKRLMISCSERTWVSVVIDGGEKKEFMLSPEEIIMLNAKERFDLLIGNAGGVRLLLNGKDVGFTGQSGEVKRIELS